MATEKSGWGNGIAIYRKTVFLNVDINMKIAVRPQQQIVIINPALVQPVDQNRHVGVALSACHQDHLTPLSDYGRGTRQGAPLCAPDQARL
ncbi:MAG: hypothetical protein Q4G14_12235 [Paracoccus sp. (in: a-proteobacteria)]|uniref:hypothetical protein n=1 Tax=Paracoccus sp. TaxID=267 RepID=UPI0026E0DBA2|nr:hypothetical protein [Paracoccus sp. (in: a-proteobacteria)]MDO5613992.1 hypothetical protein [Paracoccus sp. (in: a-proteobacteria)]